MLDFEGSTALFLYWSFAKNSSGFAQCFRLQAFEFLIPFPHQLNIIF